MYPGGNRLNERTWSVWLQRCASLTAAACIAQHGNQLVVQALDFLSNVICSFGSPYVSTAWPWDMAEDGGRLEKWSVPAKTATQQLDVAVTFHEARIYRQKPICEALRRQPFRSTFAQLTHRCTSISRSRELLGRVELGLCCLHNRTCYVGCQASRRCHEGTIKWRVMEEFAA